MTTTSSVSTGGYASTVSRYDFDSTALIEAAVEAKLARAYTYEDKVTANETKISAYTELQTLLLDLQESTEALRSPTAITSSSDDVFLNRTAYLYSSSDATATTLMEATIDEDTDIGNHTIVIEQMATAAKVGGSSVTEDRDTDLGYSGSFTLGTEDGTSVEITINDTMSLDDIVEEINDYTSSTGVKASVITISEGEYMMVLTAEETGQAIEATYASGDDVLTTLGVLDTSGDFANELQAAQNAILTVDGITLERSTNDIDDILDGITIHVYSADPSTTITLEVANDLEAVNDAIEAFVDAYNALREFVITNQTVETDGSVDEDAVLFGDSTLRNISQTLQEVLSSGIDEVSLAEIGIEFDSNNCLTIDEDTLANALVDDLDVIEQLFSYQFESSDGNLGMVSHGDVQQDMEFDLEITLDASGDISSVSVDGDSSLFTIDGTTIKGVDGTAYEGLKFIYSGSTSTTVSVSISQGIADKLYYDTETVADTTSGTLADIIEGLEDTNDDYEEKISAIESAAATYQDYLIARYAEIEAKLSEAETVLALLEALTNSDD